MTVKLIYKMIQNCLEFSLFTTLTHLFTWVPKFFNCSLSMWNLLATLCYGDKNRKMNEALNPWTWSQKDTTSKKGWWLSNYRKKVVARPLTYTFMALPLGKLESSFHPKGNKQVNNWTDHKRKWLTFAPNIQEGGVAVKLWNSLYNQMNESFYL